VNQELTVTELVIEIVPCFDTQNWSCIFVILCRGGRKPPYQDLAQLTHVLSNTLETLIHKLKTNISELTYQRTLAFLEQCFLYKCTWPNYCHWNMSLSFFWTYLDEHHSALLWAYSCEGGERESSSECEDILLHTHRDSIQHPQGSGSSA